MRDPRHPALALFLLSLAAGVLMEYVLPPLGTGVADGLVREAAVRLAYAGAAGALCASLSLSLAAPKGRPGRLSLLALVLSFCVALNNFPWYTLLVGHATVTASPWAVCTLALACFATALFEETLFRAFLFRVCLLRAGRTRRARILCILLSSAVFALSHLANLALGGDVGAVLLQVGYSFLIGCVCASLYLLTGRLSVPLVFHALYNFGGYLVPRLGSGPLYEGPVVPLTLVLSVLCALALLASLWQTEGKLVQDH